MVHIDSIRQARFKRPSLGGRLPSPTISLTSFSTRDRLQKWAGSVATARMRCEVDPVFALRLIESGGPVLYRLRLRPSKCSRLTC